MESKFRELDRLCDRGDELEGCCGEYEIGDEELSGDNEGNLNPELLPPPLLMFREMGDGDGEFGDED